MAAILDSLVGSCAKKLQDIVTEEAILILGVKKDLKELQRTMTQIQCFLNDAEQRRTEESAVNNWIGELKDAMYDADDIIDLARLEGRKLLAGHSSSPRNSVSCAGFSCLPNIHRRHDIAIRIKNFNNKLEKISQLGERFLKLQNIQPKEDVLAVRKVKTYELVEPNLVGKEIALACTRLVELICSHKEKKSYKIGIVGTGGVGKTTLAQKIYNDNRIKGNFTERAWICVSQEYSEVDVLKEVLRNIRIDYKQDETVGELGRKLATAVENKSFFLVLDDIWQPEVWINLLRTPLDNAAVARILVTTRNDTVARAIGVEDVHRVELMSDDVAWELLWKCMHIKEETELQHLRATGMKIIRMCGGLPLAIKVTASVLATKEIAENQWRKVATKSAWSMNKLPSELRGALYLSYDELPLYLKQCFLYCALYPEDRNMSRDDLVRLWVAEGFIEEQEGQLLEDTAEEYYYELIYRNLLQPAIGFFDYSWCKMHDLLRQLAQYLSQDEYFCGEPQSLEAKSLSRLRRVSIVTDKSSIMFPDMGKEHIRARTLLIRCKSAKVEKAMFRRFPCIRVLDLTGSTIQIIPDCIGSLIHLRLLDLDGTDISYLPESISFLINLQILNLQRCDALHGLPSGITQLYNLRRLGLKNTPICQLPKGIGRLKFLNDLEGFPIGDGSDSARMQDGWNLEELRPLLQLRRLGLNKLERASQRSADSLLLDKKYLKVLHLSCTKRIEPYSKGDVSNTEMIFEKLIPPQGLEDLDIVGFFGERCPTWLGSTTHLSSVKQLNLMACKSLVHLPSMGQLPSLKALRIGGVTIVTKIGPELFGYGVSYSRSTGAVAFPKLEELIIRHMPNWEEWSFVEERVEDGADAKPTVECKPPGMRLMPTLKKLCLFHCPKLRVLPRQLGQEATSLKFLHLGKVSSVKVVEDLPFLETLLIEDCESLEIVSNLPQMRVMCVNDCQNLRRVEKLDSLKQLFLDVSMQVISSLWVPRLQEQHGEDFNVYPWDIDNKHIIRELSR